MLKKIKIIIISLLLCSTSLFAKEFDWSECWCNYGANIQKGDKLLTVDGGFPWDYFDAFNAGGWAIPTVAVDFQVACPIWKLPFTFGGYGTFDMQHYDVANRSYTFTGISFGGIANYHIMLPPEKLDLYSGIKTGFHIDFSDYYIHNYSIKFDWGYLIGASWLFSDDFGINLEFGYPINKFGVLFKF